MAKCVHGVEDCIHLGEHDEDCCFNGWHEHVYVCQECGKTLQSRKHSLSKNADGTYKAPEFKAQTCIRCKTPGAMT